MRFCLDQRFADFKLMWFRLTAFHGLIRKPRPSLRNKDTQDLDTDAFTECRLGRIHQNQSQQAANGYTPPRCE
jgi:hypothetical protein